MQYVRRHGQLRLCALVVCLLLGARPTQGQPATDAQSAECPVGEICLKDTSDDIARKVCYPRSLCVSDLIEKLGAMKPEARCDPRDPQATEALILRQQITEMVLTASLQVDGFLAEIDSETAEIRAVHDQLTDQRDKAVRRSTLGSAIGTGGGAVGSALALA
jgi:hypothetical protein